MGDSVQFRSLCFGLSTAPRAFTRVMAPVSSIMHRYGLRYLDDWLILGSSFREIVRARDFLLWLCQELWVRVNLAKSSLTLSQSIDYLRRRLQTCPLRVFPTPKRALKLSLVHEFVSSSTSSDFVASTPGCNVIHVRPSSRLSSSHEVAQLRLNTAGRSLGDSAVVSWDDSCLGDLRWWSVFHWAFRCQTSHCSPMLLTLGGECLSRTTTSPAHGLQVVTNFPA